MIYNQFDVVVVPFPFTDINASKRRPALVISDAQTFNTAVEHSVMTMITTASHSSWALDVPISNLPTTGLKTPSIIRMKLFTLDHTLVLKRIGFLSAADQDVVNTSLQHLFAFL
jgi:mRNA interferase MazF